MNIMGKNAQRRRLQRNGRPSAGRAGAGRVGSVNGVPKYDAHVVQPVMSKDRDGVINDAMVLLGIGPEHGVPRAYVELCPLDGVAHLVADLQRAAAIAAEHHPPHHLSAAG
jgi:hypothetical protein